MPVRVVHIGHMRVRMAQRAMLMEMGVRLSRWIRRAVRVSVMRIMHVRMCMGEGLVNVFVLVMFGHMQPYACGHQTSGDRQPGGQRFAKRDHRPPPWRSRPFWPATASCVS
jgi:hypothetical protein